MNNQNINFRGADSAVETYKILINCSATIHEVTNNHFYYSLLYKTRASEMHVAPWDLKNNTT